MMEEKNHSKKHVGTGQRYLAFTLGEEIYAVPLLSVKEVIAIPEVTTVPQTPNYFLGIMNLRGQVISVIDLRTKLSIKPKSDAETAVIIFDLHPNSIGVVVDSIDSVLNPGEDEIADKPEIQSQKSTEYITGVFHQDKRLVLLLDISKTLSVGDQSAIARAAGTVKKAA
jgi:purine-binding chemotaxis protein CheW